jgi:hypothetical protein
MIPKMMTINHDPPHSYGDCFRACIASILEIEPTDIPHPYEGGEDGWDNRYKVMLNYLREKHKVWIAFVAVFESDLHHFLSDYDGYVLLGGNSPRGPHLVVADRTGIVHNPNPLNDGLVADNRGMYNIGFVCRGTK